MGVRLEGRDYFADAFVKACITPKCPFELRTVRCVLDFVAATHDSDSGSRDSGAHHTAVRLIFTRIDIESG